MALGALFAFALTGCLGGSEGDADINNDIGTAATSDISPEKGVEAGGGGGGMPGQGTGGGGASEAAAVETGPG